MRAILTILTAVMLMAPATVQISSSDPYGVDPVYDKLAEIDAANRILPLILTKDQIGRLLPVIETCRQNVRNQEKKEATQMKGMQEEVDKVHADALKGIVPSQQFLDKVSKMFVGFENERRGVKTANGLILRDAIKSTRNEGQRKAMIGVVDQVFNEQSQEWEDASDEAKIMYYSLSFLMNDDVYYFLVKLRHNL